MNLENFNNLSVEEKMLLVEDMGALVSSIEFYEHRIFLFSFNAMFIEVYRNIDNDTVERIHTADYSDLDKFLTRITLGDLTRGTYIL
jgi:hypothetical protein